jgi:pimeloyl-ACP methyl ester carboxylesterase
MTRTRDEIAALAALGTGAATGLTRSIHGVHRAIAGRAWGVTGAWGRPVRAVHDPVAALVYGSVRHGLHVGGRAGGAVLGVSGELAGWRTPSHTPAGRFGLGVINAFLGDRLTEGGSPLALTMSVRRDGREVAADRDGLARAFPSATGHVVVFLHGLTETEASWRWGGGDDGGGPVVTYAERLERDLGLTPVLLRYNSGRRVAENGRDLAVLLDALVEAWPVPVEQLHLVGHSMGGLVIRSACHIGADEDRSWTALVRSAVYLGTPHLGAPLARATHVLGRALAAVPETRPFAPILNRPSGGIADLRDGRVHPEYTADESWFDGELHDVPLLATCRHHAVVASVARRPDSTAGRLVGDLLVQTPSASGRHHRSRVRHVAFDDADVAAVGGIHHFSLLNHPAVYRQLRTWLAKAHLVTKQACDQAIPLG